MSFVWTLNWRIAMQIIIVTKELAFFGRISNCEFKHTKIEFALSVRGCLKNGNSIDFLMLSYVQTQICAKTH